MLVKPSNLLHDDVALLLQGTWHHRLRQGDLLKTPSGLPVLIDQEETLIDISALTTEAAALSPQSNDRIRQAVSRLCSSSYAKARQTAELIAFEKDDGSRKIGLVVGGGTLGPGADTLVSDPNIDVIAFDVYDSPHLSFIADAHWIPLADESVDFVWIQAVLEHVASPRDVANECQRVLKPGGLIYAETPFMQQVHAGRYDFTRFTGIGHRMLFNRCETVNAGALDGPGVGLIWSIRYFSMAVFRSRTMGRLFGAAFSWLKLFDKLIPERYQQMGACSFFYLGRKRQQGEKLFTAAEMLREYNGM